MEFILDLALLFPFVLKLVDAKHCTYIYDSGYMKYFFCNAFEYCCGAMCCRSQAVTFYQVWYFWLIILLTLLLCSGGSWWYRFHREPLINRSVTTSPVSSAFNRPIIQPIGVSYGSSARTLAQPPYPVQQHVTMPPQCPQPSIPSVSPPPYYEAPPSYAAATKQGN